MVILFGLKGNGSGGVTVTVIARVTGLLPAEDITNISGVTGSTKEVGGIGSPDIGVGTIIGSMGIMSDVTLAFTWLRRTSVFTVIGGKIPPLARQN